MTTLMLCLPFLGSIVMPVGGVLKDRSPVLNAGRPDAAIMAYDPVRGRVELVRTEHLGCLGIADSVYFAGDGSIDCQPGARARVSAGWRRAQERELRPTSLTFVGHIRSTEDR
jgi:hypothetical protein